VPQHPKLADKILRLRKALGLTQEHVADVGDISLKAYQRVERNESSPRVTTLMAIAGALGTTASALLDDVPLEPDDPPANLDL
jgi:transcriptional regulator with XRE-family HTH domain